MPSIVVLRLPIRTHSAVAWKPPGPSMNCDTVRLRSVLPAAAEPPNSPRQRPRAVIVAPSTSRIASSDWVSEPAESPASASLPSATLLTTRSRTCSRPCTVSTSPAPSWPLCLEFASMVVPRTTTGAAVPRGQIDEQRPAAAGRAEQRRQRERVVLERRGRRHAHPGVAPVLDAAGQVELQMAEAAPDRGSADGQSHECPTAR